MKNGSMYWDFVTDGKCDARKVEIAWYAVTVSLGVWKENLECEHLD